MIAVSIGRGRHKMMIAEHKHLAEQGAELVELRVDYIMRAVNLKRLIADRPCPVIITCRREQDGGKWDKSEEERLMLMRAAIADGVDYVDLEEDIAALIPRFGKTKRIISYHNFHETPKDIREIHERLQGLDADIVKIATMAHNPRDNVRMLELVAESETPTVAFCMGDMGTPSRILAARFGAPFTYATFHHERALAPGQLSFNQMREIYNYDNITPNTDVYGVIADPVGHSMSPAIHNAAFRELKMDKVYVPIRVPREDLSDFMEYCRGFGLRGLSVTIPHKEEVLEHVDSTDRAVDHIGAANTVVMDGFDKTAYNTDFRAALDSIDATLGRGGSVDVLTGRAAIVLGAGGVAKAIVHALKLRKVDVTIASRTFTKSEALAKKFNCKAIEWKKRHNVQCDMVINCTPIGMHPHVNETPFEGRYLRRSTIVFDTVYNPERTLLIKQARDVNAAVVTGVDMFVRQAALQFKLFTGEEAPVEVMREAIKKTIGAVKSGQEEG
jgi:3-dehydroquinate dehydratase / shikimate dehydrogenase